MDILKNVLLKGITEEDFKTVRICLRARIIDYDRGETICNYGNGSTRIGVVLSGRAAIFRTDYNGGEYMLEHLGEGCIFSELISFSKNSGDSIHVKCMAKAEIAYLDFNRIRTQCEECASPCDASLVFCDNLANALIERGERLGERTEVLTCPSIRQKLLCYFRQQLNKSKKKGIDLPFTWSELAFYINSDRAAMTREITSMVNEGIITTKNRRVYFKK